MRYLQARDQWHHDPCNYGKHLHENFEVVYMLSGECKATVEKTEYILHVGDFLVIFPFQIHEYVPMGADNDFLVISLNAKRLSDWIPIFKVTSKNAKLSAEKTPDFIKNLIEHLESTPQSKTGINNGIATSISQTILLELISRLEIEDRNTIQSTNHEKILLCCESEFTDSTFNLDILSKKTGLSIRTISRFFSKDINVPFSRFLSLMRLNSVCELVEKNDYSITNAALESGFGTIRSFNMVFKKEFGTSPRDFFKNK